MAVMTPPLLSAKVVALDAEIAKMEMNLINLRRHRNSVLPVGMLLPELISGILSHLVDQHIEEEEEARHHVKSRSSGLSYSWVSVTQFCAQWRSIALDDSGLWTHLWTDNFEWLKVFIERSKDRLLHIDTIPTLHDDHPGYHPDRFDYNRNYEMFELVVDNMYRVSRLDVGPEGTISRLKGVPAPQLEVLRCIEDTDPFRTYPSISFNSSNSVLSNTMPNLRKLRVDPCPQNEWNCILPLDMPTVTDLTIGQLDFEDQLHLIDRCKSIQNLSIMGKGFRPDPLHKPFLVELPNLQHLHSANVPWAVFECLAIPCLQQIDLTTYWDYGYSTEAFSVLTNLVQASPTLWDVTPLTIHADCKSFHFTTEVASNRPLIKFTIESFRRCPRPDRAACLESFQQFVRTTGVTIQSVDISGTDRSVLLDILYSLQDHPDVPSICIRGLCGLCTFLSLACISQHGCTSSNCGRCAFPGLTTLIFDVWDTGQDQAYESEDEKIRVLVEWLGERKKRGHGLTTLHAKNSRAIQGVLTSVKESVDNVIVEFES